MSQLDWKDWTHFFAVAATFNAAHLHDRARRWSAAKRGGAAYKPLPPVVRFLYDKGAKTKLWK